MLMRQWYQIGRTSRLGRVPRAGVATLNPNSSQKKGNPMILTVKQPAAWANPTIQPVIPMSFQNKLNSLVLWIASRVALWLCIASDMRLARALSAIQIPARLKLILKPHCNKGGHTNGMKFRPTGRRGLCPLSRNRFDLNPTLIRPCSGLNPTLIRLQSGLDPGFFRGNPSQSD
jgi:hypothetical protein